MTGPRNAKPKAIALMSGGLDSSLAVAICRELGIPLRFIGIGEKMEDLEPFDPSDFARALLASDEES